MVSLKNLAHVSFIHPTCFEEDFYYLKNLEADGLPVIIGYCGNLYKIYMTKCSNRWSIDPSFEINSRYRVSIWDITNNKLAGEGDFDEGYMVYAGGPVSHAINELRKEIRSALIRINTTSTNFYK